MQNSLKVNNFYVQYRNKQGAGFTSIAGNAVFPFTYGELLDERLDEAALTIVNDTVEHYDPLTEFKVILKKEYTEQQVVSRTQKITLTPDKSGTIQYYPEQTYKLTVDAPSTDYTIDGKTSQGINGGKTVSCSYGHEVKDGVLCITITAKNSSTSAVLTQLTATLYFTITFNLTHKEKAKYFIVARDDSIRNPYTKKYKHTLYLLERTKLLDGMLCSSITFTNAKGDMYVDGNAKIFGTPIAENENSFDQFSTHLWLYDFLPGTIVSPIEIGSTYTLPSAKTVCEEFAKFLTGKTIPGYTNIICSAQENSISTPPQFTETVYTYAEITTENGGFVKKWDENIFIENVTGDIKAKYNLVVCIEVDPRFGYDRMFTIAYEFHLTAIENRKPLKKYTVTDCVNRVLELAEPRMLELKDNSYDISTFEAPRFKFNEAQAKKYEKILAPEFSMTQCTLREQLKVIGSFIHGEPRLNENNEIYFDEYGREDKSPLAGKPFVYSGKTTNINQYATEVRSNAQNLVNSLGYAQGTVLEPGGDAYRSLRSENVYARIDDNNGIIQTLYPIYSVEKLYCTILDENGIERFSPVDITPYVFEETTYNSQLSSHDCGYPRSKAYGIYYTQGAKNIKGLFFMNQHYVDTAAFSHYAISNILSRCTGKEISELDKLLIGQYSILGKKEGNPERLAFNIVYKPIYPTMVTHGKSLYIPGKESFTKIYNQTENLIETQYFGENLKGVAARLGNVECERTYMLHSLSDVPRTGDMIDVFAISAVSVEIQPFIIKCTVGLTKDFNRISEYVGVSSVKRMYEISERQVQERNILLHNTLVIGKKPKNYNTRSNVFHSTDGIWSIFNGGQASKRKSVACVKGFSKSDSGFGFGAGQTSVALPVIASSFGNVVTFHFAYSDNYSAGTSADEVTDKNDIKGHWLNDVRYTDYYGRLYSLSFGLYSAGEIATDPHKLPAVEWTPKANDENDIHASFLVRKDSREAISVTAELEIKTELEDIIVGSALAKYCRYISDEIPDIRMYIITSEDGRVSKFDQKFTHTGNEISVSYKLDEDGTFYIADFENNTDGVCGWVICTASAPVTELVEDEDGNVIEQTVENGCDILLASNRRVNKGEYIFGGDKEQNLDFYILPE